MTLEWTAACRSCRSDELFPVIDLGEQPLANGFLPVGSVELEPRYPLAVLGCASCTLLQLEVRVDPRRMFDDYLYLSSYSAGMVGEMAVLAKRMVETCLLDGSALVVELASNDGYLLQHYVTAGVPVLGVEPARRPAEEAIRRGVPTRVAYFDTDLATSLAEEGLRADVVHANNVLAHVPDVNDFIRGIATLLKEDGTAVIETPYALDMVRRNEFDTIYHEHVFYYTLHALDALLARHGLVAQDVERVDHHGGSLRLFVGRSGRQAASVSGLLAEERAAGVGHREWLAHFPSAMQQVCAEVRTWLEGERDAGRTVAGYGAAAKGTVLLNAAGIGPDLLSFVVDRNVAKQGRRMPGTGQPVVPLDRLAENPPDSLLVLAWNHAREVFEQLATYRARGGRMLVAVPELRELAW